MLFNVPGQTRTASLRAIVARDVDMTAAFTYDKAIMGSGLYGYLVGRRINGANEYRAKVHLRADGGVYLGATRYVRGIDRDLGSEVRVRGLTSASGALIHVRARITGANPTRISIRAWAEGSVEPTGWQVNRTDATPALQVGGGVGLRAYLSGNAKNVPVTMFVDSFLVR
jgi:hypothetical protein